MAAPPSFVEATTGTTDAAGAWTHVINFNVETIGNIVVLQVLQDGATSGAVAVTGFPTQWDSITGTEQSLTYLGEFPVGNPTAAFQHLWIGRRDALGAGTLSGTNSTSEDLYIRAYNFAGVSTSNTLAEVIENSTAGSTVNGVGTTSAGNQTVADTSVVTLGADRLALQFVAENDDIAIDSFAGETGGNWCEVVAEYAEASGTDGALQLQSSYNTTLCATSNTNNLLVYGGSGTNEEQAQSFTTVGAITTDAFYVALAKIATPTDNLIIEIQTDSSNAPSGSVVGTVATIAGADLTSTDPAPVYKFSAAISLSAATKYWIVFRRSGSRDTTNYFLIGRGAASAYSDGTYSTKGSGTWNAAIGGEDVFFAVLTSAQQSGVTINGGSDSIATNSIAWGVVGFALIPAVTTQNWTGSVVSPFTFTPVEVGHIHSKTNPVVAPQTFNRVVTAKVTAKSRVDSPFSFGAVTNGARLAKGSVVSPFTFGEVVAGTHYKRSAVVSPFTFGETTSVKITAKAQIVSPFSFNELVNGVRTRFGAVVLPFSFDRVVNGAKATFGVVALPFSFDRVSSGKLTAKGAVVLPFSFNRVVSGSVPSANVVISPFSFGRVVTGLVHHKTNPVVTPFTFGVTTSGRLGARSAVVSPFTFGELVAAKVTAKGAVVLPLSFERLVQARVTAKSRVDFPITFGVFVQAQGIGGIVISPFTFGRVVNGIVTRKGQVVLPFTFGEQVQAKVTAKGAIVFPITFAEVVNGKLTVKGQVIFPITFGITTVGTVGYILQTLDVIYTGRIVDGFHDDFDRGERGLIAVPIGGEIEE